MRNFYDVGDALFIVETVDDKYFVYDCGAESNSIAKDKIRFAFPHEKQTIEAVFISHYDTDHINGIHFLLNHCQIRLLILPLYTEFAMFLLYSELKEKGNASEDDFNFVFDTENYIRERSPETILFYVDRNDVEDRNIFIPPITFEQLLSSNKNILTSDNILNSGIKIHVRKGLDWVFIMRNIRTMSKSEENEFEAKFSDLYKIAKVSEGDIKGLWKSQELCVDAVGCKKHNKIKRAIRTFVENLKGFDINALSLTVYSGPYETNIEGRVGCLYTGDYNTKKYFDFLRNDYCKVWKYIGIIQIPHHGSLHNYNDRLLENCILAVVSLKFPPIAKNRNRIETLLKIIEHKSLLLLTGYFGDIHIENYTIENNHSIVNVLAICKKKSATLFYNLIISRLFLQ